MACFFLWVSQHFTLVHAVGIRQVSSLIGAMAMALFSFSGRFASRLFQSLGLLPPDEAGPSVPSQEQAPVHGGQGSA
jgi:hypothetical protein